MCTFELSEFAWCASYCVKIICSRYKIRCWRCRVWCVITGTTTYCVLIKCVGYLLCVLVLVMWCFARVLLMSYCAIVRTCWLSRTATMSTPAADNIVSLHPVPGCFWLDSINAVAQTWFLKSKICGHKQPEACIHISACSYNQGDHWSVWNKILQSSTSALVMWH